MFIKYGEGCPQTDVIARKYNNIIGRVISSFNRNFFLFLSNISRTVHLKKEPKLQIFVRYD